ncbi:carbohydrate ABC transporter substrate-binding protein (CUT1 family) [Isoptericola variabilis J7]|uniref:Extracellular solute-binding protein family 1 n=2 Tax=Isoptericola TaxID=254250 RepID=F6FU60_ISOV2|nr:extracellular solute-binding protein family 1 [Isoptericola variabilis 225]TWH35191.1 carbohydrate ABC transporter substrate-binding protein (CUT1 family) [Isoptericola variabilis J7]
MRITPMKATAGIAASALAVTLTACTSGGGGEAASGEIDMESQVGYMENFDVGTTFKATEPVEFGLLYRDHPDYPFRADWSVVQHLEQDHNVTFDYVNVPLADLQTRRSVLISSGEAPDIMPSIYAGEERQFVSGGALLPISDYVEHMPNFLDKIERWGLEAEIENLRQADGKYYLLPGIHEIAKPQYSIAIRKDLWEKAGLTEDPATWDEFATQLEAVKQANPELEYAFSDKWSINSPMEQTLNAAAPNFGTLAGVGLNGGGLWWDEEAGEFSYAPASDGYRELVTYFAGLVEAGLMDPESVTQQMETGEQKFASGSVAAISSNDQELVKYRANFEQTGNTEAEVHQIVVPAGPYGSYLAPGSRRESGIVFAASAAEQDDFLAMLQFVDWLYYSDEGLEFAKWGVEGETYTKDASGKRTLMEDIDVNGLNPGAPKELRKDFGYHNGVWMLAHGSTEDLDKSMLREEVIAFLDGMNEKEELPLPPAIAYDEMQQEQAGLLQTNLLDIVNQNTAAFIVGDRPLSEWDAYVAELEGAGMQDYVDLANSTLEQE